MVTIGSQQGSGAARSHGTLAGQCGANNQKFAEQMEALANRLERIGTVPFVSDLLR